MNLRIFIVLSLTVTTSRADNLTSTSVGKDFVLAFFPHATNKSSTSESVLHISSSSLGHCTIDFNEGDMSQMHVEVGNQQTTEVLIPETARVPLGGIIENKAVRVSCSLPVSLHASYRGPSSLPASALVVLPVSSLSKRYYISGFPSNGFVGIVSTSDNNRVVVKLNTTCKYNHHGQEYYSGEKIIENLLETDVLFLSGHGCDFGGTLIGSAHPVAVFSGSVDIQNGGTDDVTSSQVLPMHMWGTRFIISEPIVSFSVARTARIVASSDSTRIIQVASGRKQKIGDLQEGEYVDHVLTANETYAYSSSSPVSITIITFSSQGTTYLPLPSTNLYQKEALVPDFGTLETYLMIISKTAEIDKLLINNKVPNRVKWGNISSVDSTFSVSVIPTKEDVSDFEIFNVSHSEDFSAQLYGRSLVEFAVNVGYGTYVSSVQASDYWNSKIQMSCDHDSWAITLNTTAFSSISYKRLLTSLTLGGLCNGTQQGSKLIFNVPLQQCGTVVEKIADRTIHKNYLTFEKNWRYNVICSLNPPNRPTQATLTGKLIESLTQRVQFSIVNIKLFSDFDFLHEIPGSPVVVGSGQTLYVEVSSPDSMGLDMVVRDCFAMPQRLIFNRCAYDRTVGILSTSQHVTRFSFREKGFSTDPTGQLYCDVHFCKTGDQSEECEQKCSTNHGPPVGK